MRNFINSRAYAPTQNLTKLNGVQFRGRYFKGNKSLNETCLRVKGAKNIFFSRCVFQDFVISPTGQQGRGIWLGGSSAGDLDAGLKYEIDTVFVEKCIFINCHKSFILQYCKAKRIVFIDNEIYDPNGYIVNPETQPNRWIAGALQCVDVELNGTTADEGLFVERNKLIVDRGVIQDAYNFSTCYTNGLGICKFNFNYNYGYASTNAQMPYDNNGSTPDGHGGAFIVVGDGTGAEGFIVRGNTGKNICNYFAQWVYRAGLGITNCLFEDNACFGETRNILNKQATGCGFQIEAFHSSNIIRRNRSQYNRYTGGENDRVFFNTSTSPGYSVARAAEIDAANRWNDATISSNILPYSIAAA